MACTNSEEKARSMYFRAQILANQGNIYETKEILEQIILRYPETYIALEAKNTVAGIMFNLAYRLEQEGKEVEFITLLEEIIFKYPQTKAGTESNIILHQIKNSKIRTYNLTAKGDLFRTKQALEAFYVDHYRYTFCLKDLESYGFYVSYGVSLTILNADDRAYTIEAFHRKGDKTYILPGPHGAIRVIRFKGKNRKPVCAIDTFKSGTKTLKGENKDKITDRGVSKLALKRVQGRYIYSRGAGHIFVVQGEVENNYSESRNLILIEATILTNYGKTLEMKTVYAGKNLTEEEINEMSRSILNDVLDIRFRISSENFGVEPGCTIPFIIIFKSPIERVNEFIVKPVKSSLWKISKKTDK